MSWFHQATRELQLPAHMDAMAEEVVVTSQAKDEYRTRGIVRVTQQREQTQDGLGFIVAADIVFESGARVGKEPEPPYTDPVTTHCLSEILKSTVRVTFRGQSFAVQAVGPVSPDGTVTVSVMNERREYTSRAGFGR